MSTTRRVKKKRLDQGAILQNSDAEGPGGDSTWGAGQSLTTTLESEIGDGIIAYSGFPGPSTGQHVPYFSQAASPFPGWEGEAGQEKVRELYAYDENLGSEEEGG